MCVMNICRGGWLELCWRSLRGEVPPNLVRWFSSQFGVGHRPVIQNAAALVQAHEGREGTPAAWAAVVAGWCHETELGLEGWGLVHVSQLIHWKRVAWLNSTNTCTPGLMPRRILKARKLRPPSLMFPPNQSQWGSQESNPGFLSLKWATYHVNIVAWFPVAPGQVSCHSSSLWRQQKKTSEIFVK